MLMFQLAAAHSPHLDCIYTLLRAAPHLLKSSAAA
jgi:hypothetical protein